MEKAILELKRKLEESGIDYSHLVYMPEYPIITGFPQEVILEEYFGIRVAKLVSTLE